MTDRAIRVLLIDGQIEDAHWVEELLADLSESRFAGGWRHGVEIFPIDRLSDALIILGDSGSRRQIDAVLLNPRLPDSNGLHSLLKVLAYVPEMPVVVLSDVDDPDLAVSVIRAGAQDFLAKTELDSVPLARALRLAVERGRIVRDLRATSPRDEVTGLLNRNGFLSACAQDIETAHRLRLSLTVGVLEVSGMDKVAKQYGREDAHLALMETADMLRQAVSEERLPLARIAPGRFAYSALAASPADAEVLHTGVERRFRLFLQKVNRGALTIRGSAARLDPARPTSSEDLLTSAERALCENMGHLAAATAANSARRNL
ncbi:MAG: response regulator [Acidobacteria bacterium]|nr:response regulator [Acidobacteriota bacterium]